MMERWNGGNFNLAELHDGKTVVPWYIDDGDEFTELVKAWHYPPYYFFGINYSLA